MKNFSLCFLSIFACGLIFWGDAAAKSHKKAKVVDYGYNKFVISPYSGTLAVTAFDSDNGIEIFENSQYKKAFFKLSPHYTPQQDIATCGIASSVIVLNTIYANKGKRPPISKKGSWYFPCDNILYGLFMWTEDNFYNRKVSHVIDRAVVEGDKKLNNLFTLGVTLDQLRKVLKLQGLKVCAHHASSSDSASIGNFRELVKNIAADPVQYMIVNYNLNVYAKESGGHFSPVGAYDAGTDTVLILDTWAASNTWIWIKLEDLYKSMNTLDGALYRGYILINANKV